MLDMSFVRIEERRKSWVNMEYWEKAKKWREENCCEASSTMHRRQVNANMPAVHG
jgi:hypothetical protein